jgi:DNA-3-methyladenine glycosylase
MLMSSSLPLSFFEQSSVDVARGLLGMRLVRCLDGQRVGGVIVEAEAYEGEEDLACHASHGRTARTAVMYGRPGRAYVYFTYGMHWLLNVVCRPENQPAAVLIRAIEPLEGLDQIAAHRKGRPPVEWTNGPAKICQALAIDGRFNGAELSAIDSELWIERGENIPDDQVIQTPRIGIDSVPDPWLSIPWRFVVRPD